MAESLWCEPYGARCHAAGLGNMPAGCRESGVSVPCRPYVIWMPDVREHVNGRHVTDVTNSWLLRRLLTPRYNQPSYGWETMLITEKSLKSIKSNTACNILLIHFLNIMSHITQGFAPLHWYFSFKANETWWCVKTLRNCVIRPIQSDRLCFDRWVCAIKNGKTWLFKQFM